LNEPHPRLSLVVLSYNRSAELARTLERMLAMSGNLPIVVVDNASTDGSAAMVAQRFPQVTLISLSRNMGAAARNHGVRHVQTPYVAFADDDSWWADGSLEAAVALLDRYPQLAAVCGRVLLGEAEREDPVCRMMAESPLPSAGLPGPALLGFVACAVVFRRNAYLEAGGYDEKFLVGGEEELLTLDLVAGGWHLAYIPTLTVHHYPSPQRNRAARDRIIVRNALWVAWLRLPFFAALRQSVRICRRAPGFAVAAAALREALSELPWVCRRRRVLPLKVQAMYRMLRM
jgi:GT2 family glycosyltransferase